MPDSTRLVSEYQCAECQRRGLPVVHREGFDPLYHDHVVFQGKHTWHQRPPTPAEVFRREVEGI